MSKNRQILPEEWDSPTVKLALVNIFFYIITSIIGKNFIITNENALRWFGVSMASVMDGRIWTPFTAIFTHANLAHLGFNMLFLLLFGLRLEEKQFEDRAIYFAYLVSGILASFLSLSLFFFSSSVSVGASGAVFGMLGVNVGLEKRYDNSVYKRILGFSLILFIFSAGPNTNVFAHFFGFIVGYILGYKEYNMWLTDSQLDEYR